MIIIMFFFLLAFAFFCLIMAVRSADQIERRKDACRRMSEFVSYRRNTLTVTKRDADLSNIFVIQPYRKTEYGYTSEKLIYTGATVGGVTTGGWHKSGGFYARDRGSTGKVRLYYYYESDGKFITSELERIELSPELAQQARASDIARYMSGNTIVIRHPVDNMDAAAGAMQLGYREVAFNIIENARIAASPTMEKVRDIINWLAIYDPAPREPSDAERRAAEEKSRKIKKLALIVTPIAVAAIALCVIIGNIVTKHQQEAARLEAYNEAIDLMDAGNYNEAISAFEELADYENSRQLIQEATYRKALSSLERKQYADAIALFESLNGYRDSQEQLQLAKQRKQEENMQRSYDIALKEAAEGNYADACLTLDSLGSFSDSQQQMERIAGIWYQGFVEEINALEDGVLWFDASGLREIIYATGRHDASQKILDYFGTDPLEGDSLYRRIRMACTAGDLWEAKALLEESGLLDLKPVKTLYDAVVAFVPYCGEFSYVSGDRSIMHSIGQEPVNSVRTWVKITFSAQTNTFASFALWVHNNEDSYGDYNFGDFRPEDNHFFRGVYRSFDYTAELNEDGNLVFRKFEKGELNNSRAAVSYTPASS